MKRLQITAYHLSFKHCLLFVVFMTTFLISSLAQTCDCSVDEVQRNSVQPCNLIVGSIDTVSSVSALRTAISQANSTGNRTILIEDGTYQISSTSSFPYITADNVVFRSLSGNRDAVVLTGGGMQPLGAVENGFLIAGNHVTIADLTIKDVANHGIQVSGHHLVVQNVRIQNTYEQMLKGSSTAPSIDSAIVQCSLFEYTAGIGPNWYIGGLDIHKGNGWLVRDNVFKDISSPSMSVAEHAVHFWNNSMNNTIERNIIINCDRGVGFGLGTSQNEGGIIRNNMIYNDGTAPFNDVGIGLESSPNTKVYNNTIYVAYQNAIEYRFASTSGVEIVNNLCNQTIRSRNGGTATLNTNVTNAMSSWFKDVTNGDLHLSSSIASVVDQGSSSGAVVMDDIDQSSRPQGSGYDIGADELLVSSIANLETDITLLAFPNPCVSQTMVRTNKELTNAALVVYDMLGKEIKRVADVSGKEIPVNLNDVQSGMYMLVLKEANTVIGRVMLEVVK